MDKKNYISPGLATFTCTNLNELIGPGHSASGQLNIDMYRGSAMLEKPHEYRLAQKIDFGIKNLGEDIQEVAHV